MSNLDGAIALTQYLSLKRRAVHRRRNANLLLEALGPVSRWNISDLSEAGVVLCLVVVFPAEASVGPMRRLLKRHGIETRVGFFPLHRFFPESRPLPVTEDLSGRTLTLPVTRPLKRKRITQLLSAIKLQSRFVQES